MIGTVLCFTSIISFNSHCEAGTISIIPILQMRESRRDYIIYVQLVCKANQMLEPGLTLEHVLVFKLTSNCFNHIALLAVPRTHLFFLALRPPHILFPMYGISPSKISFLPEYLFIKSLLKCYLFGEVFPYYLKLHYWFTSL